MITYPKQNQEIVFPEELTSIIQEFIKKYNLLEIEEKAMKEMREAKTFQEKKDASEKLPGRKIARAVKETAEGKISPADLPSRLQQDLNITPSDAQKMAKEIEKKILILATVVQIEETEAPIEESEKTAEKTPSSELVMPPPNKMKMAEENIETKVEIKPSPSPKKPSSEITDIYRESTE